MPKIIYGIRFKTIALMLAITLIPTLLITGWLYQRTIAMLTQEIQYNQLMGIDNMVRFMDVILEDVDVIASNILTDKELLQLVTSLVEEQDAYQNYKNSIAIKDKMDRLRNVNEIIDSIYLYDQINNRLFSTDFYGYINNDMFNTMGMDDIKELAASENQWTVVADGFGGSRRSVISNRKYQFKKTEKQFTFFINLDQKKMNALLEELKGSPFAWFYIIDENERQIAYTTKIDHNLRTTVEKRIPDGQEVFETEWRGENYFVVSKEIKNVGWKFISLVPSDTVFGKLTQIRNSMFIIFLVAASLILMFGIYMQKLIYDPIKRLIVTMVKNKEGILTTCDISSQKDEFGAIAQNFNELILTQDGLNKKLREQEVLMKNAEIRFLQSQINPHFLYNVLDTVHWMARMGKNDDVAEMTFALSGFYRSSLSGGRDLVSVSEAVKLAQAYFDIQKIRFHNRIELILDVEETLDPILVPKRLFQPLLENAINHGMVNLEKKGVLMISGIDLNGKAKFIIEDNGIGIEKEKMNQINREIKNGDFDTPGNYALKNLNSQLKMIYGEDFGLSLESSPGRGTTVIVLISKHVLKKGEGNDVSIINCR